MYLFFVDRPTGQTAWRIFTRDGSDNAASCKNQTFSGTEIRSEYLTPEKSPQSRKFGPKTDLKIFGQKRSCIKISPINGH